MDNERVRISDQEHETLLDLSTACINLGITARQWAAAESRGYQGGERRLANRIGAFIGRASVAQRWDATRELTSAMRVGTHPRPRLGRRCRSLSSRAEVQHAFELSWAASSACSLVQTIAASVQRQGYGDVELSAMQLQWMRNYIARALGHAAALVELIPLNERMIASAAERNTDTNAKTPLDKMKTKTTAWRRRHKATLLPDVAATG